MNGVRVPMLERDAAVQAAQEVGVPDQLAVLNVFRLLLRRPRVAKGTSDLLLAMLFGGALDSRLRELVIMRVGWVTGSGYEWAHHWRIAREAGVAEGDLLAVRDWAAHPTFRPAERAVLGATDEILREGAASEATVAELTGQLGPDAALEAVCVVAGWSMVSTVLRSCAVPLEDGVEEWPPDGRAPVSGE